MRRVLMAALFVKIVCLFVGVVVLVYGMSYLYDGLTALVNARAVSVVDVFVLVAAISLILSGGALTATLPRSLKVRFRRPPKSEKPKQVYGFGTVLAVGLGATLGSPLFILIPQNVVQYLIVSVSSLFLATILSVLMARIYGNMYQEMSQRGMDAVGGPSFTRIAAGTRSVRYFISRISMWMANTALAAYSEIVFLIFDFNYLPGILSSAGVGGGLTELTVYAIAGALVAWTGLNLLFEKNLLRATGLIQVGLASVLVLILIVHSFLLGSSGSWNFSGIADLRGIGSWPVALLTNTAYLYLLFFGFQEIQSLEKDALASSSVPLVSWIKKGFRLEKARYLAVAMVLTVIIAASINIFYALAVFAVHPDPAAVQSAQIPALYLAKQYLGTTQEVLMAIAFLIATVTTFVPAFLAAARHLSALGDDGYIPASLKNASWVFTLAAIVFLAVGNQSFLVEITDFMVLISLGIIVLSSIWLKKMRTGNMGRNYLPLLVSASCFVAGGAVYLIDSSVVVFGVLAILFAYLVFDVLELGTFGTQLFLSVFSLACLPLFALFDLTSLPSGTFLSALSLSGPQAYSLLFVMLVAAPLAIFSNLYIDASVFMPAQRRGNPTEPSRASNR